MVLDLVHLLREPNNVRVIGTLRYLMTRAYSERDLSMHPFLFFH